MFHRKWRSDRRTEAVLQKVWSFSASSLHRSTSPSSAGSRRWPSSCGCPSFSSSARSPPSSWCPFQSLFIVTHSSKKLERFSINLLAFWNDQNTNWLLKLTSIQIYILYTDFNWITYLYAAWVVYDWKTPYTGGRNFK